MTTDDRWFAVRATVGIWRDVLLVMALAVSWPARYLLARRRERQRARLRELPRCRLLEKP